MSLMTAKVIFKVVSEDLAAKSGIGNRLYRESLCIEGTLTAVFSMLLKQHNNVVACAVSTHNHITARAVLIFHNTLHL